MRGLWRATKGSLTIQGYHNLTSAPLQKGQVPKKLGDRHAFRINQQKRRIAKKDSIEDKDVEVERS